MVSSDMRPGPDVPGNGSNATCRSQLKMTVLAPMPIASEPMITALRNGERVRVRKMERRGFMDRGSFAAQRDHGIHLRGAARGQPAGEGGDAREDHRDGGDGHRIEGAGVIEEGF